MRFVTLRAERDVRVERKKERKTKKMDPQVSETERVSVVIKTPNQLHGDQTIDDINVNWTVKELKTHLARFYPSKPVSLKFIVILLTCH